MSSFETCSGLRSCVSTGSGMRPHPVTNKVFPCRSTSTICAHTGLMTLNLGCFTAREIGYPISIVGEHICRDDISAKEPLELRNVRSRYRLGEHRVNRPFAERSQPSQERLLYDVVRITEVAHSHLDCPNATKLWFWTACALKRV